MAMASFIYHMTFNFPMSNQTSNYMYAKSKSSSTNQERDFYKSNALNSNFAETELMAKWLDLQQKSNTDVLLKTGWPWFIWNLKVVHFTHVGAKQSLLIDCILSLVYYQPSNG